MPAPESWCICHDDPHEEEDQEDAHNDDDGYVGEEGLEPDLRCMVHGTCDECEEGRIFCKNISVIFFSAKR